MLPWWGWVLFWLVLLAVSAGLLAWMGWRTWGKFKALNRELRVAGATVEPLSAVAEQDPGERIGNPTVDVFRSPFDVAEERARVAETLRSARRERARARRPGWARGLD